MISGLTLAQQVRVAAALQGEVVLRMDRPAAHALIKVLEREAEITRIIDLRAELLAALANLQAKQERVERSVFRILTLMAWIMLFVPLIAWWAP